MNLLFKISILFLFYRKLMKYKMRLINHIYTFRDAFTKIRAHSLNNYHLFSRARSLDYLNTIRGNSSPFNMLF